MPEIFMNSRLTQALGRHLLQFPHIWNGGVPPSRYCVLQAHEEPSQNSGSVADLLLGAVGPMFHVCVAHSVN